VDLVAVNLEEGLRVSASYRHYELTPPEWARLWDAFRIGAHLVGIERQAVLYRLGAPGAEEGPAEAAPLLYLAPEAKAYAQAAASGNPRARDQALADLAAKHPFTPYWLEERAAWAARENRPKDAVEAWGEASRRGCLRVESYPGWIAALRGLGRVEEARRVERQAARCRGTGP
jgi:hypothetical protein